MPRLSEILSANPESILRYQKDQIDDVTLSTGGGYALEQIRGTVTDTEVASSYDAIALAYYKHKLEKPTPDDLIVKDTLLSLIVNHGSLKDQTFLDACCGTGWLMNAVVKNVTLKAAIGRDISHEMISIAQRDAAEDPYKNIVTYQEGSVSVMDDIPDNSIAVIGSSNGLDCIADVRKAFGEFNRVLKVGGRLVFSVRSPARNELYAKKGGLDYKEGAGSWYKEMWPGTSNNTVLRQYLSYSDWIMLLRTNGFNIEFQTEPYAQDHVYAIDPDIWMQYNQHTGRKSALIMSATKVRTL